MKQPGASGQNTTVGTRAERSRLGTVHPPAISQSTSDPGRKCARDAVNNRVG